eukprot:TRINITY_DN111889_c0_g1_i2.p1 TRINITY_DN111889_c0_g1~~TRINITY_DN111889_c0_g1_i2.p1  ORF type:complete len:1652 (+),score=446.21 TRINITY_DN111889_c0_g1_i2:122-5077(+)
MIAEDYDAPPANVQDPCCASKRSVAMSGTKGRGAPRQARAAEVVGGNAVQQAAPDASSTARPQQQKSSAEVIAGASRELRAACEAALETGLARAAALPRDVAAQLAHAVWEVKLSSWKPPDAHSKRAGSRASADLPQTKTPEAFVEALKPLKELSSPLSDVFEQLTLLPVAHAQDEGGDADSPETLLRLSNLEVGVLLTAMYFDAGAVQGIPLGIMDEAVAPPALKFLSCQVAPTLEAACEAAAGKGRRRSGALAGVAPRLTSALARALRSVHHMLAAARYAPVSAAHRAAPLAARCLVVHATGKSSPALTAMRAAARDLLLSVVGLTADPIRSAAVEEVVDIAKVHAVLASKKSSGDEPSAGPYLSAICSTICASCLPCLADEQTAGAAAGEAAAAAMRRCYEAAEGRASFVVGGILQRTLLTADKDSEGWSQLEAMLGAFLNCLGDPRHAAAPLLLLCFARGLARIAKAPRSATDVAWSQREFATKLLGFIAEKLSAEKAKGQADTTLPNQTSSDTKEQLPSCSSCNAAVSTGVLTTGKPACDLCALREWAMAFAPRGVPQKGPDAFWRLLLAFLEAVPHPSACLLPAAGRGERKPGCLAGAALPSDHAVMNSSFLLCALVAGSTTQSGGGRGKAKKRGSTAPRGASAVEDASRLEWAPEAWQFHRYITEPAALSPGALAAWKAVAPRVAKLYVETLGRQANAPVTVARQAALETLIDLAKGSPLAHVRRQAVVTLGAACRAEPQLLSSRCVAETVAVSLQDESAIVRFGSVDLISRLDAVAARLGAGALAQRLSELKSIAAQRCGDPSPVVRRAACLVACSALGEYLREPGSGSFAVGVGELLRRMRQDTPFVRTPVLGALERVFWGVGSLEDLVKQLAGVMAQPGVGGAGIRDLLQAHSSKLEPEHFKTSMSELVSCLFNQLRAIAAGEAAAAGSLSTKSLAGLLEQVSAECPEALHGRMKQVRAWLAVKLAAGTEAEDVMLAQCGCRIMSNVLPSWADCAAAPQRQVLGEKLSNSVGNLLSSADPGLLRAAVECLCVSSTHLAGNFETILTRFNSAVQQLQDVVQTRPEMDMRAQRAACLEALLVGSTLEFLDIDAAIHGGGAAFAAAADEGALVPAGAAAGSSGIAEASAWLLSALCLTGPLTMRPSLVPCIGFMLRRYPGLLHDLRAAGREGGAETPMLVFKTCLEPQRQLPGLPAVAAEALAALLRSYQKAAEDSAAKKTDPSATQGVTQAAQQLAELYPQVAQLLATASQPEAAAQALAVLQPLVDLGVVNPAALLPSLLASSLAGFPAIAAPTRALVLRLVEASPSLLCKRLAAGVQEAASSLAAREVAPGSLLGDAWRFGALREAFAEHLDSKAAREHFLEVVLTEVTTVATGSSAASGAADGKQSRQVLLALEILFGIVTRLPLRTEGEVARIMFSAGQFVALHVGPILSDGAASDAEDDAGEDACPLGVACASLLFQQLAEHWAAGDEHEMRRLLAVAHDHCAPNAARASGASEQPLPESLLRRAPLDLAPLFRDIAATVLAPVRSWKTLDAALKALLLRRIPVESCLLSYGSGLYGAVGARRRKVGRGGKRPAEPAKKPPRTSKKQRLQHTDKGSAAGTKEAVAVPESKCAKPPSTAAVAAAVARAASVARSRVVRS